MGTLRDNVTCGRGAAPAWRRYRCSTSLLSAVPAGIPCETSGALSSSEGTCTAVECSFKLTSGLAAVGSEVTGAPYRVWTYLLLHYAVISLILRQDWPGGMLSQVPNSTGQVQ